MSPINESKFIEEVGRLKGPILVLGASGFVGANIFRAIGRHRDDVHGTTTRLPAWRLDGCARDRIHQTDLLIDSNLDHLLDAVNPKSIFDCVAYGAYSFERQIQLIHRTNFDFRIKLMERLLNRDTAMYVHAGSSSEYGDNSAGPDELDHLEPNSHYSVSKASTALLISYYGRHCKLPCANLRLYSVYGPLEDSSRLIPNLVKKGLEGSFPEFVSPDTSRDFIYIDDVVSAFIATANRIKPTDYGCSFNIGSGKQTTIAELAKIATEVFEIKEAPRFTMPNRNWDLNTWFAKNELAKNRLAWEPTVSITQGLSQTASWMKSIEDLGAYERSSKIHGIDVKYSVSAIIACYKDAEAIPIMYSRLTDVFHRLNIDYEIIFVNDCSPDNSEGVIQNISRNDRRVLGISHSRNFGSQAAFMSGMAIANKNSCVLLDGDLQDPPEIIEQFVEKWREGFDVVYGRRVKREAPVLMQIAYKAFYRVFDYFSYIPVPHDAGDFSLMDRKVVNAILSFPERDLFLRGVRAFAGFKQTGVDYVRPERMFGKSTNNLLKNLGWAKRGILSFSNSPLNMISFTGISLLFFTTIIAALQIVLRIVKPEWVPQGVTTILLAIMFFGSLSIFSIAVLGEYLAKVFEEVKQRPLYIRRSIVENGEVRSVVDHI
jgi:nucleoside-diphosphate-sugar epimerase/glycosyltransferase involved in cell wall biosynthesis